MSEASIYATLASKSIISNLAANAWPGAQVKDVPGTKFRRIIFADKSTLLIKADGTIITPEELARDFFELFSAATCLWLQQTPTKDWPLPIRTAYGEAAGKDPFAASVWEEVSSALGRKN